MGKTCLWMKYELILKDKTFHQMENLHLHYGEMTIQIGREKKKAARYRLGIAYNENWVSEEVSNGNGNGEPNEHFAMEVLSNYLLTKVKNSLTLEDELPTGKEVTKHILVKKHNQTTNSLVPSEIRHCATSKESGPTCSSLKCLTVLCLFHTRLG